MAELETDQKHTMTAEHHQKAVDWMQGHAPGAKCWLCENEQFHIPKDFVAPPIITEDGSSGDTGYFIPFFMVGCTKCGNTFFINAKKSRVLEQKEETAGLSSLKPPADSPIQKEK